MSVKSSTVRCLSNVVVKIDSKEKIKMKTQNIMASSYRLKVHSTQNKGDPFFSGLNHGVYYYTCMFG